MKDWKWMALACAGSVGAAKLGYTADNLRSTDYDMYHHGSFYHANELSLDQFGAGFIGENRISHWSADRLSHNSRLGAGAGLNYFFTRNIGIGGDAFSINTEHSFVDTATANVIARFPIKETSVAPYIFGGAGYQFENREQWLGNGGLGVEFRVSEHLGFFLDARYVLPDKSPNYGMGRAGLRFAF